MGRVTGLGGVFFKAADPKRLFAWYEQHLGLKGEPGGVLFKWRDEKEPGKAPIAEGVAEVRKQIDARKAKLAGK